MTTKTPKETTKRRASLFAIPVAAVVCLFGFWRLSPGITFIIAAAALVVLVVAIWVAGKD